MWDKSSEVVSKSNSVTHLKQTPKFKWCVVRCGYKNGHHKDMCLKETGLCVQKLVNHFRLE